MMIMNIDKLNLIVIIIFMRQIVIKNLNRENIIDLIPVILFINKNN